MKFSLIASALLAVAAAQYGAPAEESCSAVVTVTVTEYVPQFTLSSQSRPTNNQTRTAKHTPSAPASHKPTGPAPYPTTAVPKPSVPAVGTGYPPKPSGTASPSGTGAYSAPPSQFTGAASSLKVGGALAAGAVAALFL